MAENTPEVARQDKLQGGREEARRNAQGVEKAQPVETPPGREGVVSDPDQKPENQT